MASARTSAFLGRTLNMTPDSELNIGVFGIRSIPSTYGGYETFLTALLPELVARGHQVTLYARSRYIETPTYSGVRIVSVPAIYRNQTETLSASITGGVRAAFKRHDVVLAFNVANAIGCLLPLITRTPVIMNTDGVEWARGKWSPLGKAVFRSLAWLAARSSTLLISDSVAMKAIYAHEMHRLSCVIPYCWTDLTPRRPTRVTDRAAMNAFYFAAGRFVPENHLTQIAECHARHGPDGTPLLIAGAAAYPNETQRHLEAIAARYPSRVVLLGHVKDRHEYAWYCQNASLYIHGHSVGGINPALIEAMGVGANIVALDTPFNREALGPEGHYFSDTDAALAAYLGRTQQESDVSRQRAAHRARTLFSLDAVSQAYEAAMAAAIRREDPPLTSWDADR